MAVYSALKVFAFADRLTPRAGEVRGPVHVRIKPVNACNESCWFCAYRAGGLSLGDEMELRDRIPPAKMFEIVDDLIALDVRAVAFSGGGEPLLYPELPETIRRLAAGRIAVGCLTNGFALSGEVAEALARDATWVRISIDGWDGPSYARSRRVREDAFERVLRNGERFVAATGGRCTLGFSFIVTRENAEHLAEFCARARTLGAAHVKLSACVVANEAAENEAYHAAIAATVAAEIARARALEGPGFEILDHYHALGSRFERANRSCPMLDLLTVIGADCAVYTCQDKAYTEAGRLGSIRERSFRDLWLSAEQRERRRRLDPSVSCLHHCTAHAKNELLLEYRALEAAHLPFV
jgi:MoaA/NifB/PqqE/SkfB family radical SAM enzyme